jgi:hypothetical protein
MSLFSAPPSYIEAMGSAVQLNEEGEHSIGSRPYHPMYPVYNFTNPQQPTSYSPTGTQPLAFGGEPTTSFRTPGSISEGAIIEKY